VVYGDESGLETNWMRAQRKSNQRQSCVDDESVPTLPFTVGQEIYSK